MEASQRVAPLIQTLDVGDALARVLLICHPQNLAIVDAFTGETLVKATDLRPDFSFSCGVFYNEATHQTLLCDRSDASAVLVVPPTPIGFVAVVNKLFEKSRKPASTRKPSKDEKEKLREALVMSAVTCYVYHSEGKALLAALQEEEAKFLAEELHQSFLARLYKTKLIDQLKAEISRVEERRLQLESGKARKWNAVVSISVAEGHVLLQIMGEFLQHRRGDIHSDARAAVLRIAGQCYETWDMLDITAMARDMPSEARALLLRHEYWRRKSLLSLDKTEGASLQVELNGTDVRVNKLSSAGFARSETTRFGMKMLLNRSHKTEFSLLSQTTRILLDDVMKALPRITGKRWAYANQPSSTTTIDSTLRPAWSAESTGKPEGDHFFCEISDERFPFAATVKDNSMVTLWLNTALGELLQATTFKITGAKEKRKVHSCFQAAASEAMQTAEPFVHVVAGCILPPNSTDAEQESSGYTEEADTKQGYPWHTEGVVVEIVGGPYGGYGTGYIVSVDWPTAQVQLDGFESVEEIELKDLHPAEPAAHDPVVVITKGGKPQPGVLVTVERPRACVKLIGKRSLKRYKLSQVFRRTNEDLWSNKRRDDWEVRISCTLVLLEQVNAEFWISMYAVDASNVTFASSLQLAETFGIPESCSYDSFAKVSHHNMDRDIPTVRLSTHELSFVSAKLVEGATNIFTIGVGPAYGTSSSAEFDVPSFPLPSPLDCEDSGSVSSETLDMEAPFMDDLMDGVLQELPPVETMMRKSTAEHKQRQTAPAVSKARKRLLVCVKEDGCAILDPTTLNELRRIPLRIGDDAYLCREEHGQGHYVRAVSAEQCRVQNAFISTRDPPLGSAEAIVASPALHDLPALVEQIQWESLFFRSYTTSLGWSHIGYVPKEDLFLLRWSSGFNREIEGVVTNSTLVWDLECVRRSVVALLMVDVRVLMVHRTTPGRALFFHGNLAGYAEASKLPSPKRPQSTEFAVSAWVSVYQLGLYAALTFAKVHPAFDKGNGEKEMIIVQRLLEYEGWYELGISSEMKPFIKVISRDVKSDKKDTNPVVTVSNEPMQSGEWCHLAGSFGPAGLQLFVNGEVTTTLPSLEDLFEGSQDEGTIVLGGDKGSKPFRGFLRQVRVWDQQVSQDQVRLAMYMSSADMEEDEAFAQGSLVRCLMMWALDDEGLSSENGASVLRSHLSNGAGNAQLVSPSCAEYKDHAIPLLDYKPKLHINVTDKVSGECILDNVALKTGNNVLDLGGRTLQSIKVTIELDEAERERVWLNTVALRLAGRTQKTLDASPEPVVNELESLRSTWVKLFDPGFEATLYGVLQAKDTPAWKRIAAMKLMDERLNMDQPFAFMLGEEAYKQFVRYNVIQSSYIPYVSEELADKAGGVVVKLMAYHGKSGRVESWFDATVDLLSEACEHASSATGLKTVVELTTMTWPKQTSEDYLRALSKSVEILISLGKTLSRGRMPEHNILKTYFGDFSRPLHEMFVQVEKGLSPIRFEYNREAVSLEESSSGVKKSAASELSCRYSDNRVALKVHSRTVGVELESHSAEKACESRDCIKDEPVLLKYTDTWKKNRDAVIVLDLGEVRQLSSLTVTVSSQVVRGMFWVEAWSVPPPIAGDRFLLYDSAGTSVEVYAFSGQVSFHKESTTIGIRSTFPTVVPRGVLLRTGKWYYEVRLVSASEGVAQIGWADCGFAGNDEEANGVGDDLHSWAFDGNRCQKWSGGSSSWGKRWRTGQTLGCAIDVDKGEISFSLNGVWNKPMGVAFEGAKFEGGVFPAVTGEKAFQFKMNLGQNEFKFKPPSKEFQPVWADLQSSQAQCKTTQPDQEHSKKKVILQRRMSAHNQVHPSIEGNWEARYLRVVYSQTSRESSSWMEQMEDTLPPTPMLAKLKGSLDAVDYEAVQNKIQEFKANAEEGAEGASKGGSALVKTPRTLKQKKSEKAKAKKHKKSYAFTPKKPAVNTGLGADGQVKRKTGSKVPIARLKLSFTGMTNFVPSQCVGQSGKTQPALGGVIDKMKQERLSLSQELETAREHLKVQLERLNTAVITTGASWECLNVDEVGWDEALAKIGPGSLHTSCLLVKDALDHVLLAQQRITLLENQWDGIGATVRAVHDEYLEHRPVVDSDRSNAYGRYSSAALHLTKLVVQKIPDDRFGRRAAKLFQVPNAKLHQLFHCFCMYDPFSSEHRRLTGKLIRRALRNAWQSADDAPAKFVRESLENNFRVPSITLRSLALFPEQQVFTILKSMIEGPAATTCVKYLLALIGEVAKEEGTFASKMSFLGWCLVLLRSALECERSLKYSGALVIHKNTVCSVCGSTPIIGIRYKSVNLADCDLCEDCEADLNAYPDPSHVFLRITKPLPLPPLKDQPKQVPVGALMPDLKTVSGQAVHKGVSCDECHANDIVGNLYKCLNCDDFNACEKCILIEGQNHYENHVFVKLRRPLPHDHSKNPSALVPDAGVIPMLLNAAGCKVVGQDKSDEDFVEGDELMNGNGASAQHEKKTTVKGKELKELHVKPRANLLVDLAIEDARMLDSPPSTRKHMFAFPPDANGRSAEKVDNCRAVKLVFDTLCSSELFLPLKLEIFLIAAKVLSLLVADADHATVEAEVLSHEGFDRFIYHVASCAEPFVHAATLRLCTDICQLPEAGELRKLLRSKLVKVLQSPLSEPAFVLELILLSLTQEDPLDKAAMVKAAGESAAAQLAAYKEVAGPGTASTAAERKEARKKIFTCIFPKNLSKSKWAYRLREDIIARLVLIFEETPLRSAAFARAWSFALRILYRYGDADFMVRSDIRERLCVAIRNGLNAGSWMVNLIDGDVVALVSFMLSSKQVEEVKLLQGSLLDMLVQCFLVASPVNPRLYRQIVSVLHVSMRKIPSSATGLDSDALIALVDGVAAAISTETHTMSETLASDDLELLDEMLLLICEPMSGNEENPAAASALRKDMIKAITTNRKGSAATAHSLLEWLTNVPEQSESTRHARRRLSRAIVFFLSDVLGREVKSAKPLLELCIACLSDPTNTEPGPIGNILKVLCSREELALLVASALSKTLRLDNSFVSHVVGDATSTKLASISSMICLELSTAWNSANSTRSQSMPNSLLRLPGRGPLMSTSQDITSLCKITMNPGEKAISSRFRKALGTLLRQQQGGAEKAEQLILAFAPKVVQTSFALELPCDVVLEELRLDFSSKTNSKEDGATAFPSRVSIESGIFLEHMSQAGMSRAAYPQADGTNKSTATAKVQMILQTAVRFVRVRIFAPTKKHNSSKSLYGVGAVSFCKPCIGDKVVRGPDWMWADQDGGAGKVGIVVGTAAWNDLETRGLRVQWETTGKTNLYRWAVPAEKGLAYDLKLHAPELEADQRKVCLERIVVKGVMLEPRRIPGRSRSSHKALGLMLELIVDTCKNFSSVKRSLARDGTNPLAMALVRFVSSEPEISQNTRTIIALLAEDDVSLSSSLMRQVLGPVHVTTPSHAALAAELCTQRDTGTPERIRLLWDFVFNAIENHETSPLLLPFISALSIAIEGNHSSLPTESFAASERTRLVETLFGLATKATIRSETEKTVLTFLCTLLRFDSRLRDDLHRLVVSRLDGALKTRDTRFFQLIGIAIGCHAALVDQCMPLLQGITDDLFGLLDADEAVHDVDRIIMLLKLLRDLACTPVAKRWIERDVVTTLLVLLTTTKVQEAAGILVSKIHQVAVGFVINAMNLHPKTVTLVAQFLVSHFQSGGSNEFCLELFAKAIHHVHSVTVAVWYKETLASSIMSTASGASTSVHQKRQDLRFKLNPSQCGSTIKIGQDGFSATQVTYEKWGMVRADLELPTHGVSTWDVVIDTSPKGHIFLGVATAQSNLNSYLGNDKFGWGYIGNRGAWYNRHKIKAYGQDFRSGHIVTVKIDMDAGALSFALNGEDLGVAFEDNFRDHRLFPAFSLYQKGDSFTVQKCCIAQHPLAQTAAKEAELSASFRTQGTETPLMYHRAHSLVTLPAHTSVLNAVKAAALGSLRPVADNSADSNVRGSGGSGSKASDSGLTKRSVKEEWTVNDEVMDAFSVGRICLSQVQGLEEPIVDIALPAHQQNLDSSVYTIAAPLERFPTLLERMASVGGMQSMLKLARERSIGKGKRVPAWVDDAERYLVLPGFEHVMVRNEQCVELLLEALELSSPETSKDKSGSEDVAVDPQGVMVITLTDLFRESHSEELRGLALENGTFDCILLRLGLLQAEKPIDSSRVAGFLTDRERGLLPESDVLRNKAEENSSQAEEKKELWAPGFGFGDHDTAVEDLERQKKMKKKHAETLNVLECLTVILSRSNDCLSAESVRELKAVLLTSCFLRVILSFLFGNTYKDLLDNAQLYKTLFRLILSISQVADLAEVFVKVPGVYKSVNELVQSVHALIQDNKDDDLSDEESTSEPKGSKGSLAHALGTSKESRIGTLDFESVRKLDLPNLVETCMNSINTLLANSNVLDAENAEDELEDTGAANGENWLHELYSTTMRPFLFGNQNLFEISSETGDVVASHHYRKQIEEDIKGKISKVRTRRLNRELKALQKSLPIHFNSSIFVKVDTNRPFILQALITGPSGTPYDSGCFLFDIYVPTNYPNDPPKVNLMTTGNGTVRFNPNLYNNGKVCLSLLGTWRGGASGSEQWQKSSTIQQVLVSIQSLILGSEYPYFNEPGVESQWGTEEGELQKRVHSNGGYERLRIATIQHAMIGMLKSPPKGFETIIQQHFLLKRQSTLDVVEVWVKEASISDTNGHHASLVKLVNELKKELVKLGPSPSDKKPAPTETQESLSSKTAEGDTKDGDKAAKQSAKAADAPSFDSGNDFMSATALLEQSQNETKAAVARSAAGQLEQEVALEALKDIFPFYPVGLLKKALELTSAKETLEVNTNAASMWIVNEGEKYLNKHLELYKGD